MEDPLEKNSFKITTIFKRKFSGVGKFVKNWKVLLILKKLYTLITLETKIPALEKIFLSWKNWWNFKNSFLWDFQCTYFQKKKFNATLVDKDKKINILFKKPINFYYFKTRNLNDGKIYKQLMDSCCLFWLNFKH